jgi:predicted NBD/HSP70 family sugar kinase
VLERAQSLAPTRPDSSLASGEITHQSLLLAFEAGDPVAREVVLEAGPPLGRVLAVMIGTLGVRDIVLVGPMTAYGEDWLDSVRTEAFRSALPLLVERSSIHLGRTGDEVVEIGAAAMLMTSELGLALAA